MQQFNSFSGEYSVPQAHTCESLILPHDPASLPDALLVSLWSEARLAEPPLLPRLPRVLPAPAGRSRRRSARRLGWVGRGQRRVHDGILHAARPPQLSHARRSPTISSSGNAATGAARSSSGGGFFPAFPALHPRRPPQRAQQGTCLGAAVARPPAPAAAASASSLGVRPDREAMAQAALRRSEMQRAAGRYGSRPPAGTGPIDAALPTAYLLRRALHRSPFHCLS